MTPKERVFACLNGSPMDHLARVPILMQFAAEHIGSTYGAFVSDYRVLAEANIRCAEQFGFDQLSAISDPYRETSAFGGQITVVENGVPQCIGPLENDEEIEISKLRLPDPMQAERMRDRIEGVRLMHQRKGDDYSIMGWVEGPAAEAADLRGLSNFFMDLIDDEAATFDLMELTMENAIHFAHAQIRAGADTIGIGEAIASQVSADVYNNQILPHTRRLVQAIRDAGAFVKLHICGNISHILEHIGTMPIHAIDLDHMVNLQLAREKLGPDIAICTNLDPVADIQRGTPEEIREKVRKGYQGLGNRCLVNAGCEIPSGTPTENLQALCAPLPWRANP